MPINEYENFFKNAGFENVKGEDKTDLFIEYLKQELENFVQNKEKFLEVKDNFVFSSYLFFINTFLTKSFNITEYEHLVESWNEKLRRTSNGYQKWGLIYAEKANN